MKLCGLQQQQKWIKQKISMLIKVSQSHKKKKKTRCFLFYVEAGFGGGDMKLKGEVQEYGSRRR